MGIEQDNKYQSQRVTRAKKINPSGEKIERWQREGGVGAPFYLSGQGSPSKVEPEQKPH